jgi:hypothetical protein
MMTEATDVEQVRAALRHIVEGLVQAREGLSVLPMEMRFVLMRQGLGEKTLQEQIDDIDTCLKRVNRSGRK